MGGAFAPSLDRSKELNGVDRSHGGQTASGSRRSAGEAAVDLFDLFQMPPNLRTVSPREAEERS